MVVLHGQRAADLPLDIVQPRALLGVAQRDREAAAAGATGTPDPVDIAFRQARQIVIEDMRHRVHVDPARGDIGRDEHLHGASAEGVKRTLALTLRLVAVQRLGGDAGFADERANVVGDVLLQREDDRLAHFRRLQERQQRRLLVGRVEEHHRLVDPVDGGRRRCDLDLRRIAQQALGQRGDRLRHRCREQQRMAIRRQRRDETLDRLGKAHVEHLIGFVEHQCLELRQVAKALVDEVEQASRCGDDDVDALFQRLDLMELADPAEDRHHARVQMAAEAFEAGGDLRHQFARGREHEDARTTARRRAGIGSETVQQRQYERCGLARAGLRHAENVTAAKEDRDRLRLDRGRVRKALLR